MLMNRDFRYLSLEAVMSQEKKKKNSFIAGGIIAGFFAFGAISGITNPEMETRQYMVIYLVMMLPGLFLLWNGYRIGQLIGKAKRYESIFAADRDGTLTVEELSNQMGMNPLKIFAELEVLFRKGFFRSCTLQRGGVPCVILSDAMMGEAGTGFVMVRCSNCNGENRIRAGSRGQCSFCGAAVEDKVV